MILEKRVILSPDHPTWSIFDQLRKRPMASGVVSAVINGVKYRYYIKTVNEDTQSIECVRLVEVKG